MEAVGSHFRFPRYWWGLEGGTWQAPTHSIVDLLKDHVLDSSVAALLWALLHRRASILMVGGWARGTGKTTALTALTGFFPPETELIVARGTREDFGFLKQTVPERTYVMVGEFSDHTPGYLWGEGAARVWRLTGQGYRFAGTMHAAGVEDMLNQVTSPPVSLMPEEIARALQLSVFLSAIEEGETVQRRITGVQWYQPAARGPRGLGAKSLVAWSPGDDRWTSFSSPDTWEDLAGWAETPAPKLRDEIQRRVEFLDRLSLSGDSSFDAVRARLLTFPG